MHAFSRTLVALARSGATGVISATRDGMQASVSLFRGRIAEVDLRPGDSLTLGDVLEASSVMDTARYVDAMFDAPPQGRVGRWFVDRGIATEEQVQEALAEQFVSRIARLLRESPLDLRFEEGLVRAREKETAPIVEVVLGALERVLAEGAEASVLLEVGSDRLEVLDMTTVGRLDLSPEALETLAGRDPAREQPPRALRQLAALRIMGLVGVQSGASFSALLRKRQQLRGTSNPGALLDLAPNADAGEARKALRRLTHALHPDRFGINAPAGVRSVAAEVMTALVEAEGAVRRRR